MKPVQYVLVTPAYNEERYMAGTIECVIAQTARPEQWVIVDDASTDRTAEIVQSYADRYDFIQMVRVTENHPRDYRARIEAIKLGRRVLRSTEYEFIGTLDADVSFGTEYFGALLQRFLAAPRLGLAGGAVIEPGGGLRTIAGENARSVANAAQLLRRACHEAIGEFPALPYGAPDTFVEVAARMLGWEVRTFPDLMVNHHRRIASANGLLRGRFRQGRKDYSFGYLPAFEVVKCIRRLSEKPRFLGAATMLAGFSWAWLRREDRGVSQDFVRFLRKEQSERLHEALRFWPAPQKDADLAASHPGLLPVQAGDSGRPEAIQVVGDAD